MTEKNLGVDMRSVCFKKPESLEEYWPANGKKEVTKKDGVWIQYRDILIGPFPNRTEASRYDGQIQEIISGWIDKSRFAGRIFPHGDQWFVERWMTNDGPFPSMGSAWEHRGYLYREYRRVIEEAWQERGGKPAVPGYSLKTAKGITDIPADIMYENGKPVGATDELDLLQKAGFGVRGMKWGESGSKPRQATDDIIDVSGEESIRKFIEENRQKVADIVAESTKATDEFVVERGWTDEATKAMQESILKGLAESGIYPDVFTRPTTDDIPVRTSWFERRNEILNEWAKNASDGEEALKNYQGYVIINTKGPTHIDPATGKAHRNDHICSHQCHALARKAREEYQAELRQQTKDLAESGKDIILSGEGVHIEHRTEDGRITKVFNEATDDILVRTGWFGPTEEELTEWEKNRQKVDESSDDEEVDTRTALYHEDVPVLLGMMLDQMGTDIFQFNIADMLAFKGKVRIEKDETRKGPGHYIVKREGQ